MTAYHCPYILWKVFAGNNDATAEAIKYTMELRKGDQNIEELIRCWTDFIVGH